MKLKIKKIRTICSVALISDTRAGPYMQNNTILNCFFNFELESVRAGMKHYDTFNVLQLPI